ncbi:unnamed protein product [Lampetra fluviatilis]
MGQGEKLGSSSCCGERVSARARGGYCVRPPRAPARPSPAETAQHVANKPAPSREMGGKPPTLGPECQLGQQFTPRGD